MPLLRKIGVIAAKVETTPGTAVSLSASDANLLAYDPMVAPAVEMVDRPKLGSFNYHTNARGLMEATATFRTDFIPNNSNATSPVWAETLLPACGWVQSSDTFTATDEAPGSNVKTLTIALYQNGRITKMVGAVGDFTIVMESGKPAAIDWSFRGVLAAGTEASATAFVTDGAILAPTWDTVTPWRSASTMTLAGSYNPLIQSATFASGNEMQLRECNTTAAGYLSGIITGRTSTLSVNPEAGLVATDDTYGDWRTMASYATNIVMTDGSKKVTIASAACQTMSVSQSDRNGIVVDDMEIRYNTPPTIVFASA